MQELSDLWKAPAPDAVNTYGDFSPREFAAFNLKKNGITSIQFNAKTLIVVSHFFRKCILMTFDHVRETFLFGQT